MTFFLEKKFDSLGFFSIMMAFFNESHLFDMVSSHANIKGRIIRLIIHRSQINCSEVYFAFFQSDDTIKNFFSRIGAKVVIAI